MDADFLGTGWRFPILPDRGGGLGYVSGQANVEQSLLVLLQTTIGERVMRPGFGTELAPIVFAPGSRQNLSRMENSVREAVRDHEPRVELEEVRAELDPQDETRAVVSVRYRVRQSNTRSNLVFPFYVDSAEVGP
ncbi:MAG: GPW/gp25 family protein [Acidimicrobiales bacterium]